MNNQILDSKNQPAIQKHLDMLQGVINRMATNSANCKNWLVVILAAILVLIFEGKIESTKIWVLYIPTGLFFFLDSFYLGKERLVIKKQNEFVEDINNGNLNYCDLYIGKNTTSSFCNRLKNWLNDLKNTILAIFSFSTLIFYGAIILTIYFLNY